MFIRTGYAKRQKGKKMGKRKPSFPLDKGAADQRGLFVASVKDTHSQVILCILSSPGLQIAETIALLLI